jgi:3-dehydroquinate synthase
MQMEAIHCLSQNEQSAGDLDCYEQRFSVQFDFPVHFTRNLFHRDNDLLASVIDRRDEHRQHRVKVFIDAGVAAARKNLAEKIDVYFKARSRRLKMEGTPVIVPDGEQAKNSWDPARDVMACIADSRLCRQSYVLAIGGGSMLDMVGLAAALVHRGVRLIRVPTTVLAQNDAGVGVKNGVNHRGMKNFAGTFAPPFAVMIDYDFLSTLPFEHWIGGVAEAFKVAMIKDSEFFEYLRRNVEALRNRDAAAIEQTVKRCAILHMEHIRTGGDPFEFGSARPLDFGHWSAHRLEMLSENRLGHGRAVSIGIALDTVYAQQIGLLSEKAREAVLDALEGCGLPIWSRLLALRSSTGRLKILKGLDEFQEHLGGRLTITLPNGIGNKVEVHEMDEKIIENAVDCLKQRSAPPDTAANRSEVP